MVPKNDHYIFAPDDMLKDLGKSSQIQYGWRWDNISIVVGSLSSEVGSLIDLNLRKKLSRLLQGSTPTTSRSEQYEFSTDWTKFGVPATTKNIVGP